MFGVSKKEEQQLREAARSEFSGTRNSRVSLDRSLTDQSITGSSAYETADEADYLSDDMNHPEPAVENEAVENEHAEEDVQPVGTDVVGHDDDDSTIEQFAGEDHDVGTKTNSLLNAEKLNDEKEEQEKQTEEENEEKSSTTAAAASSRGIRLHELDWDDEHDPANPLNWGHLKRSYITFTTAVMCLCVSLGSSLYVSGVFEIMATMGASRVLSLSGLTFYLVGLAFGPALAAPISETFGRKIVYLASFPTSMLFTMGIGLSNHIYQILILRFFCGFFASPALAVAGGTITDIWRPEERGVAMALFCVAPFLGPVLGPIVGGFAAEEKGWKWTQWVSLMFSGAILPLVVFLPETYKPVILVKRAKKRGVKLDLSPLSQVLKVTVSITLLRPLEMLVVEPIVLVWSFYIAFIFAVLFGFFEAFPIIFQGEYGMSLGIGGLPFIGVGIGLCIGVVFYIGLDRLAFFPKNEDGTRGKRDESGEPIKVAPEAILPIGKVGAICLPIALFWLGWTGRSDISWVAPTASGIPFGFGLILIFFTNMLYFSSAFPPASVASALGANNLLRYLLASVFPLFTPQMYEKLDIDWATSVFAFISLALLPIPWIFTKIGPRLRQKSKFGFAAIVSQSKSQQQLDIEEEVVEAVSVMEGLSRSASRRSQVEREV